VVAFRSEKAFASSGVRIWRAIDQHPATKQRSPDVEHRCRLGDRVHLRARAHRLISSNDWREYDDHDNFRFGATRERPGRLDRGQLVAARRHGPVPKYQNWCQYLSRFTP
jgi:hypothetical protein